MNNQVNTITQESLDELTHEILGCAIEVHKQLGPGLLESVYEKCFLIELSIKGLNYKSQTYLPIIYKGFKLDSELRIDVIVNDLVIVELKAAEAILPVHKAQLLTYMKLLQKPKGVLINFNCTNIMKEGQKTMVNELYSALDIE